MVLSQPPPHFHGLHHQRPHPRGTLTQLGQRQQRCVDRQRQFDGQLRGHHGGQDEGALQEQLVAVTVGVLCACNTTASGSVG